MPRSKKPVTDKEIEQMKVLARAHCSNEEIAAFLNISVATLKTRFQPLLKTSRQAGLAGIRAKQFELAINGNVTMLIWLGKVLLWQRECLNVNAQISSNTDVTKLTDQELIDLAQRQITAGNEE